MKLIKKVLITSVGLVLASGSVFAKSNSAKMEVSFQVIEACVVNPEVNVTKSLKAKDVQNVSVKVTGSCSSNSSFMVVSEKLSESKNGQVHLDTVAQKDITIGKNESVLVNIMY